MEISVPFSLFVNAEKIIPQLSSASFRKVIVNLETELQLQSQDSVFGTRSQILIYKSQLKVSSSLLCIVFELRYYKYS